MPKVVAEKTEWIQLGFELFAEHGHAAVNVDKLATTLKCNRSSFYWHFKTKENFIEEILNYWIESDTSSIIDSVLAQKTPEQKMKELVKIVFKSDPYIDFIYHLKRYAIKHPHIHQVIDNIDAQRIEFVSSVFMELGVSQELSQVKARMFYKYLIGYHEMIKYKKQSRNYQSEVWKELNQFIKL